MSKTPSRISLPARPCRRCGGQGNVDGRFCRPCVGTGCLHQIVIPLQVLTMSEVSEHPCDYERLAVLHMSVSGDTALVWGQTDTGIRVSIELPVAAVHRAPTILFDERNP